MRSSVSMPEVTGRAAGAVTGDFMQDASAALAPVAGATLADGYNLTVTAPVPEACAECLAPKSVLRLMAAKALEDQGIRMGSDLRIDHPAGHHKG